MRKHKRKSQGGDGVESGLGHELRNLVQVVSGYLEILAARTEDVLLLRYIETAQAAAREIADLATNIDENPRGITP